MKVKVGVSNHHVHLTEEDLSILFNDKLTKNKDINQPGQFSSNEVVTLKTDKNKIENVRILGPTRDYTQVEISKTDAYKLGLNPPVRDSNDLIGSEKITIVGPKGEITKNCCIIAKRHIHITKEQKKLYNLGSFVNVKINSIRGGVMENVYVKVSEKAYFEMHIDTDEANAFFLKSGDEVEIIGGEENVWKFRW